MLSGWTCPPMIIVAGRLKVAPAERARYLAGCEEAVRSAREASGCLDFSLSADLLDASRINVFERWESDEDLKRFRGSGPSGEQLADLLEIDVRVYPVQSAV